jgi:hypothetical protein
MKKHVAVALVAACVAAGSSEAFAASKPFSVTAVRTSSTTPTKTTSSFKENLLTGKKVIGNDAVKCKVVGKQTICAGTFTFKAGGTITFDSPLTSSGSTASFKIGGGTGTYKGASGTIALTAVSSAKTKITFELK